MDYTFYAPQSHGDFDRLIAEVVDDIDCDPDVQRSLTTITLDCDDLDNPDEASIIIYGREWLPDTRYPKTRLNYLPIADVASMNIQLPSERMLRLPPMKLVDGEYTRRAQAAPPFTSLHHNNDVVVASPEVVKIMEAVQRDTGLDIESMVRDLEATYNLASNDLDPSIQKGLDDVLGERSIVMHQRRELERKVRDAYIGIMNHPPGHGYERRLDAAIQELIDAVQSGQVHMPNLLRENRLTIETLVADYNALEVSRQDTRHASRDVFVETIEDRGIGMPSFFDDAETAVSRVGFDSDVFLRI